MDAKEVIQSTYENKEAGSTDGTPGEVLETKYACEYKMRKKKKLKK